MILLAQHTSIVDKRNRRDQHHVYYAKMHVIINNRSANNNFFRGRTIDLESALIDGCDFGTLRNICKGRPVPEHLRAEIWQVSENSFSRHSHIR